MSKPFTIPSLSTSMPITLHILISDTPFAPLILASDFRSSEFNYLSPTLASRHEMLAFPKAFPALSFLILYFLPQGPYSVSWYHHIYVIAASSYVFKCDLSLALFPHFHDASISLPLKINSPYSLEIYSNAHTIDIN